MLAFIACVGKKSSTSFAVRIIMMIISRLLFEMPRAVKFTSFLLLATRLEPERPH